LVTSFRGGSSDETDRFLRSRHELFFDALSGRPAECQFRTLSRHTRDVVHSPSSDSCRDVQGIALEKFTSRTDRRFSFCRSIPWTTWSEKESLHPRTRNQTACGPCIAFPSDMFRRKTADPYASVVKKSLRDSRCGKTQLAQPSSYLSKEELAEILAAGPRSLRTPEGRRECGLAGA